MLKNPAASLFCDTDANSAYTGTLPSIPGKDDFIYDMSGMTHHSVVLSAGDKRDHGILLWRCAQEVQRAFAELSAERAYQEREPAGAKEKGCCDSPEKMSKSRQGPGTRGVNKSQGGRNDKGVLDSDRFREDRLLVELLTRKGRSFQVDYNDRPSSRIAADAQPLLMDKEAQENDADCHLRRV